METLDHIRLHTHQKSLLTSSEVKLMETIIAPQSIKQGYPCLLTSSEVKLMETVTPPRGGEKIN